MTTPTITCEQFADSLADFLERDVDEATRARIELHALGCNPCGALLADLRAMRIDAANLPELVPTRDLWAGIAARIETPIVELAPGGRVVGVATRRRYGKGIGTRLMSLWIGVAAAGLVAITAAITHEVTKRSAVATVATQPASTPAAVANAPTQVAQAPVVKDTMVPFRRSSAATSTLASNRPSAEQTYDAEISRLRAIVAVRRSTLDTATVGVIERNLKVIDDAIAQCKQALGKDPASRFLLESLNDALDTKVQLLRTAAMLPART